MVDDQQAGIEYSTAATRDQRAAWAESFAASPTTSGGVDTGTGLFAVAGICPRCDHPFEDEGQIDADRRFVAAALRRDRDRPPKGDRRDTSFTVVCGCRTSPAHPGCPEGSGGCGATWRLVEDD